MWCLTSVSVPCPVGNRRGLIVGILCGLLVAPVVPLGGVGSLAVGLVTSWAREIKGGRGHDGQATAQRWEEER